MRYGYRAAKRPKKTGGAPNVQVLIVYGIGAVVLASVIVGAIVSNFMAEEAHESVRSYITGFLESFDKNDIVVKTVFIDAFYKYFRVIFVLWAAGFFSPGIILILSVVAVRAFTYGFTTAALVKYFGLYGFVIAFNCYAAQSFFFFPAMLYVSYSGVFKIFGMAQVENKYLCKHGGKGLTEYCFVLLIGLLCSVIVALIETYLTPLLLEYIK